MEDQARDDAAYLKSLRLSAGLDMAELATLANLSAGQIRQLEDGGESLFYSPQIKAQSLRRVIHLLESPQPSGKPTKVQPLELAPRTSANVIEDIIRLSEKNLKGNVVSSPVRRPANTLWMSGLLLVFAGGSSYLFWMSNRSIPQSVYNEWVEPLTRHTDSGNPPPSSVTPNSQSTETSVATNTTSTTVVTSAASAPATVNAPVATTADLPATAAVANPNTAPVSVSAPVAAAPPVEKTKALAATIPDTATAQRKTKNQSSESAPAGDKVAVDCTAIKSETFTASSYSPSKAASYVYVQAIKAAQICIEDGQKHRTVLTLEPGTGRSIHGSPPWTLVSHELKSVQIYFQGTKVLLPAEADKRIVLKEQPLAQ